MAKLSQSANAFFYFNILVTHSSSQTTEDIDPAVLLVAWFKGELMFIKTMILKCIVKQCGLIHHL